MPRPSKPVRHIGISPLTVDLARRLSRQIVTGELAPAQHLSELALAGQFEVSRTPVRKALQLMAEHGFVEFRPQEGAFVAQTPPAKVPGFSENLTNDELYQEMLKDFEEKTLGEAWTEKDVLERYGTSRSVLTKALVRLASDGLIEKRKGHGWQFLPSLDNAESVEQSYRFRLILECSAIREPDFRVDETQLERSRQAHQQLIDNAGQPPSATEFFALNSDFHEMIGRFSGNRFIVQAIQQQNQLRRIGEHVSYIRGPWHVVSCTEHLRIIEALQKGDIEWAAALMHRHLTQARSRTPEDKG
jgi:DNA-binding GntR family transcriptional regulator